MSFTGYSSEKSMLSYDFGGISNAGVKAAMEAGRYPKRFPTEAI
ncbi:hypothetical protein ACQE32_10410 [Pantoea sp. FN0302]